MSVGGIKDSTWSVNPLRDLSEQIQKSNNGGLKFSGIIYDDLDHMDVALVSFAKGLQESLLSKE